MIAMFTIGLGDYMVICCVFGLVLDQPRWSVRTAIVLGAIVALLATGGQS